MSDTSPLSNRHRTILTLVDEGQTNQQIAETLHLSENTIKWYLQQIFQILGVKNRVQAVRLARQQGYLPPSSESPTIRHNLPAATTPFVGREKSVAQLHEYILRPQPRLISICGLGGTGKTRLAIEAARLVGDAFADGVYFVPLETVETAAEFWGQLLNQLQIPRISTTSQRQLAREYLQNRRVLLVLDNTEYLPLFQTEISWLLAKTDNVQVVCTSRVRLNLQSEQFFPLDGLEHQIGIDSPAYRLFLHVARRHHHGFEPNAADQEAIVSFCQLVEGLPLAIELAATWMDVLGPDGLMRRLHDGLRQIAHDAPDRPVRQRSLETVIDYSWQHMSEDEQVALMRLTPLRGLFSRQAALEIGECTPAVLKKLIHGSLVQPTAGGQLKIHPLIRQFSEEKVKQSTLDLEELFDRHMMYYLHWLAEAGRNLRETMRALIVQQIREKWHQLEIAWWRAVARARWDLLESCIDLVMYFEACGIWGEGRDFFRRTQQALPADCQPLQARLNEALSVMAIRMYDMSLAEKLAKQALATLARTESTAAEAGNYAHITLTATTFITGGFDVYTEFVETLSEKTKNHLMKYSSFGPSMLAGMYHCARQQYEDGVRHFLDTIEMSDADAYYMPAIRCMLGLSYVVMQNSDAGKEQFVLALERALEISMHPAAIGAMYELDRLEHPHKPFAARLQTIVEQSAGIASDQTIARVAINIGANYIGMGFYDRGHEMFKMARRLMWGQTSASEMAQSSRIIGKLLLFELFHRRLIAKSAAVKS